MGGNTNVGGASGTGTGGGTGGAGGGTGGAGGGTGGAGGGVGGAGGGVDGGSPFVVINEVESSGGVPGDWAELYNAGSGTADLSGWIFKDNDDTHVYVFPNGTTIAPGAHLVLEEASLGYGLGASDSARLFDAGGVNLVDTYTWTSHAASTYGRCPDGSGPFLVTIGPTKGAANDCAMSDAGAPGPGSGPWPGGNNVATVDGTNVFGGNLSGLTYQPASRGTGVLWAVQNGPSTLFRIVWNGAIWAPDTTGGWGAGKTLRYPGGTGVPDAEGVTKAEGSSPDIYVATERDNDSSATSRLSVLLFDTSALGGTLTATREWNLTPDLPPVGANAGLEAITWVPDSFLVGKSFQDERLGKTYDPADYPGHGKGLFIVGIEADGKMYAYALDHVGGGFLRVATIASGHPAVVGIELDRETGYLWAHCDDICGNVTNVLTIDDDVASPTYGRFVLRTSFARPSSLANGAHEGIAIAPEAECSGGQKSFFWADDGEAAGHSIRRGTIPCGPFL